MLTAPLPRRLALAAALLLPLLLPAARLTAEDPKPGADPKPAEDDTLRLFHVHALVSGRSDYLGPVLGLQRPDQVNDEERPLFGAESEEATLPVGSLDELIELLKSEVDPASWESVAGADIRGLSGRTLLVRNVPEVHAALGAALKRHEDRWLRPVSVEVQAVRLPADLPRGALSAEAAQALATAALASRDGPGQGPGLSVTALPGQRVSCYAGRQVAYLADYDVEVAQKAKISDPIMMVTNVGLAVDVRAVPSLAGDRVMLGLEARLSRLEGLRRVEAGDKREVESPGLDLASVRSVVEVPASTWTLLDGASSGARGWAFLVRARVGPRAAQEATRGGVLPTLAGASLGRYERRAYDTDRLTLAVRNVAGRVQTLMPSNYTPPEAPEQPEPSPAVQKDALVELVRAAVAPDSWSRDGAELDMRGSTLYARAQDTVLAGIGRLLRALERELLWSVEVDAEVLDVPADMPLPAAAVLSPAEADALAQALAGGSAQRLDRVRVSSMHGARNSVRVGREQAYLSDYDVEIAEDAVIANPILQTMFTGVVLDVRPAPTSTLTSAVLSVRCVRTSAEEPLRKVESSAGPIEAPMLRVLELRCDLEVPFGATALAGSAVEDGRRTLLLLTPRLVRAAR